jgi:hypothetical protein
LDTAAGRRRGLLGQTAQRSDPLGEPGQLLALAATQLFLECYCNHITNCSPPVFCTGNETVRCLLFAAE